MTVRFCNSQINDYGDCWHFLSKSMFHVKQ